MRPLCVAATDANMPFKTPIRGALADASAEVIRELAERGIAGQLQTAVAPVIPDRVGRQPNGAVGLGECGAAPPYGIH